MTQLVCTHHYQVMHSVKITVAVVNSDSVHSKTEAVWSSANNNGRFQTSYERAELAAGRGVPRRCGRRSTGRLDGLSVQRRVV